MREFCAIPEHALSTLSGGIAIDRCTQCKGLWFDIGEAEALKDKWMSDYIDDGDPDVGKEHNLIRDINCPRCGNQMDLLSDPLQKHIQYEACADHGMYFDAANLPTTSTRP